MKLRTILATALCSAVLLSSCSKEQTGPEVPVDGAKAKMGLSFTLPQQAFRAVDLPAATDESAVKTIAVYVFNANGVAAGTGGYKLFSDIGNEFDEVGGKYTLKAANNITTVSGSTKVYVAVNHPNPVAYATENALLAAIADVADLHVSANGFTMFSEGKSVNMLAYDDANPGTTTTKVEVNIDRVVAKIVASTNTATYTATWSNGLTLTYAVKTFGVYNEAIKTYLAKNPTTLGTLNTFAASAAKTPVAVVAGHPSTDAAKVAMAGFYVGENAPGSNSHGNTTYSMVSTTVTVNKAAKWDNNEVVYEDVNSYGANGVWVVNYDGIDYVTEDATKASAIKVGLDAKDVSKEATIYKYTDGYVHFMTYLNKTGTNIYSINRNEFIHLMVNGVKALDGRFPGYPGDPNNPGEPTDPEDPNGPDPVDPVDPIDPDDAMMNVEITVNPWKYVENPTILE